MSSENQLNTENQRINESGNIEFTLDDGKNPPLSGGVLIGGSGGEYPHAILSLECGVEAGFEIAGGWLRVLIYRPGIESPEIINIGEAAALLAAAAKTKAGGDES